ncbi:MAG: Rrf2 family transcriptional regulator [Henriciella sp.]
MRLTAHTDYALRMIMHLAVCKDDLVTIADVSEKYDLSKNHLMKVANQLSRLGYVTAVRGRNGGLRLARPADRISVGAMVRDLEGHTVLVECFAAETNQCLITPACKLKSILHQSVEAFYSVLDEYSVADLVQKNLLLHELIKGAA